jgi:hypothetical protein
VESWWTPLVPAALVIALTFWLGRPAAPPRAASEVEAA